MRSICRVSLILCTGAVLACWIFEAAESCDLCLFPQLRRQSEAVDLMRQQRNSFVPRVAHMVDQLGTGGLSLREASRLFCRDAAENHPMYLKFFRTVNEYDNVETKVAHHLLDELFRDAAGTVDPDRAQQLEREFESMLADE